LRSRDARRIRRGAGSRSASKASSRSETAGLFGLPVWLVFTLGYSALMGILLFLVAPMVNPCAALLTARLTASTLRLIGLQASAEGTFVSSSIYSVRIIAECAAIYPLAILLAAILAYPSAWGHKFTGAVLGTLAIVLMNQVRLVSLFFIGHWFPNAFETVHLVVWQSLMVFCTVLIWLLWAINGAPRRVHRSA
jgi:exosortase H (IPTLxxWG-CTERM-specific)